MGLAVLAMSRGLPSRLRAGLATVGLILASALLVHLSGGFIESHFHFFCDDGRDCLVPGLDALFVGSHFGRRRPRGYRYVGPDYGLQPLRSPASSLVLGAHSRWIHPGRVCRAPYLLARQ